MKSFVFFGFLVATILQTECQLPIGFKKAMETCLEKVDMGSKEPVHYKLIKCIARSAEITNDDGVFNIQRWENFVVAFEPNMSETDRQNLTRKCTEPNEHYDAVKLMELFFCSNLTPKISAMVY